MLVRMYGEWWHPMQQSWAMPSEVRNLPFDLLRSQNYPLLAHSVVGAILNQMSPGYRQVDVYLPQRMGFTRHKQDAKNRDWASVVTSAVRAFQLPADLTGGAPRASAPNAPYQPIRMQARAYFDHLPRASDKLSRVQAISSELPARLDRVPPLALDDLAARSSTMAEENVARRFTQRTGAVDAIAQAQAMIAGMVFGTLRGR